MCPKLFISVLLCFALVANAQNDLKRPNILWIVMEDTSPQFIGCYGNKDARTPVIDSLAKIGTRFANAFSTGTVCSPSRTCIITGVKTYKTGTGHHRSNYPIPDFIKGFPFYMQQAGYYVTNNNKTDYNVANVDQFIKEAWNESSNKATWRNRKDGQPFFSVFNFMDSHQSRTMTETYDWYVKNVLNELPEKDRISDTSFLIPPFYNDTPEMRKQFARVYNSIKLTDNKIGALLEKLEKDHLKDSTIIFFYADHGQGEPRGKTNGINLGYRVPFIICIPEMFKHLSPWGKSGVVTSELIDFEDLAPTLISLAGGKIPSHLTGRVLLGKNRSKPTDHLVLSSDRSDNGIDLVRSVTNGRYMYSRNFMPFMPELRDIHYMEISEIKKQMVKDYNDNKLNALQKQLFEPRPAEFLYDIENDLWETKNLANNAKYTNVVQNMRNLLKTEILQSKDVLLMPEYDMTHTVKTKTPYEYRLDNNNYPIRKIFNVASLSGFRGKDVVAKQMSLLKSTNNVVRYWAIIGLKSQLTRDVKTYAEDLIKLMEDQYLPVAITASAIIYDALNSSQAKDNLIKYSLHSNTNLSLMAVNYLLYVNVKQPFIQTIQTLKERKENPYEIKAACLDFLGSLGIIPNSSDSSK